MHIVEENTLKVRALEKINFVPNKRRGVYMRLYGMINFGAQTLHHSTGKKSFRTLQNVVAQSKCMPIISFLNATIMIVSMISTKSFIEGANSECIIMCF